MVANGVENVKKISRSFTLCFAEKRQYKRKNHFVKMGLQIMIFDAAHKRRIQGKWAPIKILNRPILSPAIKRTIQDIILHVQ